MMIMVRIKYQQLQSERSQFYLTLDQMKGMRRGGKLKTALERNYESVTDSHCSYQQPLSGWENRPVLGEKSMNLPEVAQQNISRTHKAIKSDFRADYLKTSGSWTATTISQTPDCKGTRISVIEQLKFQIRHLEREDEAVQRLPNFTSLLPDDFTSKDTLCRIEEEIKRSGKVRQNGVRARAATSNPHLFQEKMQKETIKGIANRTKRSFSFMKQYSDLVVTTKPPIREEEPARITRTANPNPRIAKGPALSKYWSQSKRVKTQSFSRQKIEGRKLHKMLFASKAQASIAR